MKRFFFLVTMVWSLSACDNTKMQLRAPAPDHANAASVATKSDTLTTDSINTDTISTAVKH